MGMSTSVGFLLQSVAELQTSLGFLLHSVSDINPMRVISTSVRESWVHQLYMYLVIIGNERVLFSLITLFTDLSCISCMLSILDLNIK